MEELSIKSLVGESVIVPEAKAEVQTPSDVISIKSFYEAEEDTRDTPTLSVGSLLQEEVEEPSVTLISQVDRLKKEYGRPLLKEDFLADDRLMELVYTSLEGRYKPASLLDTAGNVGKAALGGDVGGLSGRDYRSMDREDAFEIWQNYQRSFAGGQTVTTAAEITYGLTADDKTKEALGAGYLIFDAMDNAFTGEGSWSEMADAVWDYTKAAVYDPSTILSFGVGKAISHAGTKTSAMALRKTLTTAYQQGVSQGATKTAAKAVVGSALKSAKYAIPDAIIAVGTDVAYQMQLLETGAQKDYSKAQTAFAAAGGMVIPAMIGTAAGVKQLRNTNKYFKGTELDVSVLKVSGKEALEQNSRLVKRNLIVDYVDDQFGEVKGKSKKWLQWDELKDQSGKRIRSRGEQESDTSVHNRFYKYLWLGDKEAGKKGYYEVLKEAGFRVTPAMREEFGAAGVFGQALGFLSDAQVAKMVKAFEKGTGKKLGITKTSKGLVSHYIKNTSDAGSTNWLNSHLTRLENATKKAGKGDTRDIIKSLGAKADEDSGDPQRAKFALSVYKRLLTSSLSTTGTNIKGFGLSTVYNTAADLAIGTINFGQGSLFKLLGNSDLATTYFSRSYGSFLGAARRGTSVFSPSMEMEYAELILDLAPEYREKLFRDITADGGVREAFSDFNLDKANKAWKYADEVTKGAQTLTGVRLQDEITKLWAFGNNVDQAIIREYGVVPSEFFKRSDAALEMSSDRFKSMVLEKALFRTMKETASINWTTLPGTGAMRGLAKGVSKLSSNSAFGYVMPFGNYMNTNLAVIGDLTGVNAVRFLTKRFAGRELDFATEEGAEALGKAVVGWSAIALAYHGVGDVLGAKDRVEQGYAYNQRLKSDGSIEDIQYDGFTAAVEVFAQAIAHGLDGRPLTDLLTLSPEEVKTFMSNIPQDIWLQIAVQTGGQVVRDVDDVTRSVMVASQALTNGDLKAVGEVLSGFPVKVIQGVTRPLEPIDQLYGLFTDKNMNPDFRQGPYKLYEALKYVDNLTGVSEKLPTRATATQGYKEGVDAGKLILGVRGSKEPVLFERMLNSAGLSSWKATNFMVPPEVKNTMDAMAAPLFELYADKALKANPNFFKMRQQQKEDIIAQVKKEVSEQVLKNMKNGAVPKSLELFRSLSQKNKGKVSKILDFMGEDDLETILKRPDAYETMKKVEFLLKEYDSIFVTPLNLD